MCGIAYLHDLNGQKVNKKIFKAYLAQRGRGMEGFGFYIPKHNKMAHHTTEKRIKTLLNKPENISSEILFHHRMPTSTPNTRNSCHPFSTKDYFASINRQFVMVHNGYLYNDDELKANHKKLGITYASKQNDGRFNDSEALLYDLALYATGQQDKIQARGAVAFIMVEYDTASNKPIALHFGRNSSPLRMVLDKNTPIRLASEGAGEPIKNHTWYTYNYSTKKLTQKAVNFPDHYYVFTTSYRDNHSYSPYYGYDNAPAWTPTKRSYWPNDNNAVTEASNLFVHYPDYRDALAACKRKIKLAEDTVLLCDSELKVPMAQSERQAIQHDQMEAYLDITHWKNTFKTLEGWYEEDEVMGKAFTNAQA